MTYLVLSLVGGHCDFRTRTHIRRVDQYLYGFEFEQCLFTRVNEYLCARRCFSKWRQSLAMPRVYKNTWKRTFKNPEREILIG